MRPRQTYGHIGNSDDEEYIKNQGRYLEEEKQKNIGTIPDKINKMYHTDVIQSALYGIQVPRNTQPIDNSYDPYNEYLQTRGLLRDNPKTLVRRQYVNIDSNSRRTTPKMIISDEIKLEFNPLLFVDEIVNIGITSSTQHLLKIICDGHKFNKNDKITLTGLGKTSVAIKTIYNTGTEQKYAVIFTPDSTAVIFICNFDEDNVASDMSFNPNFRINNSGIEHSELKNYNVDGMTVTISGFDVSNDGKPFIGNIPINFLNGTHTMYFTNPHSANQSDDNIINIPVNGIVEKITGFYIKLPFPFSGDQPTMSYTLTLRFNHYGGYGVNRINAEYPFDEDHSIGYHYIYSTGANYFTVAIDKNTYYDDRFGGDNIYISRISELINGDVSPNNYKIELHKSIQNVIMVKLINTIFPNTYKIFRDNENDTNNKLYWQNIDEGNIVHSIHIEPGNYSAQTLAKKIENAMRAVPKKYLKFSGSANTIYTNYNYVTVDIDVETDIVKFSSFTEAKLLNPIQSIDPQIETSGQSETYSLTLFHANHGLRVGNKIVIKGMISDMGIPESSLNGTHIITSIPNENTYTFTISDFNLSDTRISTGGGNNVKVYTELEFRLLFNTDDTFGNELGFRNVGNATSITVFNSIVTNATEYYNEIIKVNPDGRTVTYDESGNEQILRCNSLKLNGSNYILMVVKELQNIVNISKQTTIKKFFAKINLTGPPEERMYDTFVSAPVMFYEPIELFELNVQFYGSNGKLFDFHGLNHSYVLEITSIDYNPSDTNIVSKNSPY